MIHPSQLPDLYVYINQETHQIIFRQSSFAPPGTPFVEPTEVQAYFIGHHTPGYGEAGPVKLSELEHVGTGAFGPARGSEGMKWTADSYHYEIFRCRSAYHDRTFIARQDGSGVHFYLLDELDCGGRWAALCRTLTPDQLWDVCHALVHTYETGRKVSRARYEKLFLDGRLRKKRQNNRYRVEILPPAQPQK